jgi:CubicO group peptidase (beta-lactamase class C family)
VPHHDSVGGVCRPNPVLNDPSFIALERPGSGFRGPANELARLYSGLLTGNLGNIPPAAIRLFTGRRREGRFDRTFQARVDCGYGFIVNSGGAGPRPAPYGYGPHASAETFGHSGAQTGCGFADPAHGLAVAWLCNGMPGEPAHQRRQREINSAIYEDLGLAAGR